MLLINEHKAVFNLERGVFLFPSVSGEIQELRMGGREVRLLRLFIERRAQLVSKDEILSSVWPGCVVCENNVLVTLSGLKKMFRRVDKDCQCFVTYSNRGYVFYPERSGFRVVNACL